MLGYIPTNISVFLSILIDENRDYFKIICQFMGDYVQQYVQISINLEESILKDQKIKDSDIINKAEQRNDSKNKSFSVKDLWGMPKLLQRTFQKLHKFNKNTSIGLEFKIDNESEEEEII